MKKKVLLIFWFMAAACQRQHSHASDTWRASDPTYVPFTVKEIVVSASNRFVGLTVDEHPQPDGEVADNFAVYVLDLKSGSHRRLGSGNDLLVATTDDQFIYAESSRSSKPPALINGLDTVRAFEIGENNGVWWNPKTRTVIFETGWPKDSEGFDTITLLKPEAGTSTIVHVQEISELLLFVL